MLTYAEWLAAGGKPGPHYWEWCASGKPEGPLPQVVSVRDYAKYQEHLDGGLVKPEQIANAPQNDDRRIYGPMPETNQGTQQKEEQTKRAPLSMAELTQKPQQLGLFG